MSQPKLTLTVPIRVYSIYQDKDEAVVGPEVDFESLPYFDKDLQMDMNADVPYLAESVISRPFENTNFLLKKGVHVNWDFPKFLKTTKFDDKAGNEFPAVPNRWLIARFFEQENAPFSDKSWIIESDALLTDLNGAKIYDMAQTSIPADFNEGERPYTYMGKVWDFKEWVKNKPKNYTNWKEKHGKPLTAMGWGSPSFDVFYPNCRGVFGFYDPDGDERHTYKVVGWYEDMEDDYWLYFLKSINWDKVSKEIDQIPHLSNERKGDLKNERFEKRLQEKLGISFHDKLTWKQEIIEDINKRSDMSEERKEEFIKELIEGVYKEKEYNKVNLEEETADYLANPNNWDRMVCCGESIELGKNFFDPKRIQGQYEEGIDEIDGKSTELLFAMGNTPIEALSAMIVHEKQEDLFDTSNGLPTDSELTKLEDSLSAMLMGDRLKSKKLDIGPKFREYRHDDQFVAREGGSIWVIEKVSENTDQKVKGEVTENQKLPPKLPKELLPYLTKLNQFQKQQNRIKQITESCRFELYADWYRYMHTAYPPPGETEEFLEVSELMKSIKNGSLKRVKDLEELLQDNSSLSQQFAQAKSALQTKIEEVNREIKEDKEILEEYHWQLQSRPAPRFWEPTPPSMVVAIPRSESIIEEWEWTGKKPEGKETVRKNLTCKRILLHSNVKNGEWVEEEQKLDYSRSSNFTAGEIIAKTEISWASGESFWSTDLPIFRGEWEGEVYSVATMTPATKSSGNYDANFITNNYLLGENEPDLDENATLESPLSLTKTGNIYKGSTFVNQTLDDRFRYLLHRFKEMQNLRKSSLETMLSKVSDHGSKRYKKLINEKEQQEKLLKTVEIAEHFLNYHNLLVVTLNGFNSALLQRHESIQLHPADPLGFKDYKDFADEVGATLHNQRKGVSPDPHAPFLPIRAGALQLLNLRLVDTFGRYFEVEPTEVTTAVSMVVPQERDWFQLTPRLSQPARWNFRFLNAATYEEQETGMESQSHEDSSPIEGWMIPNLLDKSLDFFQRDGSYVGSIRTKNNEAQWEKEDNVQISEQVNKVVQWITTGRKNGFLDAFIDDIEEAMDNIHPNDREGQTAFSVLMGRPIAIVRLGVELELKGLPAVNISWSELRKDLNRSEGATNEFEKVQFPYRLGEYRQRNDGLVGYWKLEKDGKLSEKFSVNDAITGTIIREKVIAAIDADGIARTGDTELDKKIEEWKLQDVDGRNLFQYLLDEEDVTVKKQDLIQPYVRKGSWIWEKLVQSEYLVEEELEEWDEIEHYARPNEHKLTISPADEMQQFLVLMDPYGVIHLSSGIQPVKSIQLPEQFIKDTLNRIEMTFLTAPILTPEDQLRLSLPSLKEYDWYWREQNQWPTSKDEATAEIETSATEIKPFQEIADFPERSVLREGQLVLKHKKEE